MRSLAALAVLLVATLAAADPPGARRQLGQASDALDAARKEARRSGGQCRSAISNRLEDLSDRVEEMKKTTSPRDVWQVTQDVNQVALAATMAGCSPTVQEHIQRSIGLLEDARATLRSERREDRRDDRREDRDNRDGFDDSTFAQLQPLSVTPNSVYEGEPAVRVAVPELRLSGMRGRTFYLAVKFRSFEGNWSDWVTTQQWSVPSEPFIWKNAFNHFFRYSALAEEDHARGRFIAHVSVFDGQGRELAWREATFQARLASLPPAPPVAPPQQNLPPGMQVPILVKAFRDCGTGNDPGCLVQRDGQPPMDAATFQGYVAALRSNASELHRLDMARGMFRDRYATALQFGAFLDMFSGDLRRMDLARVAAPRLTDPQRAIGFASKFQSSLFARDYTNLMGSQPVVQGPAQPWPHGATTVPGQPPPGVGVPPPPQPPPGAQPQVQARDCGTGNDPGCMMSRNGVWAMDGVTFSGYLTSIRATPFDSTRQDLVETMVSSGGLTALQFGQVMDLFGFDSSRLEVARVCAPRIVNPGHAIGFASKFQNSFLAQEYTQLMAAQR